MHPSAHLGSPQRMGKAPWSCSHLGSCVQRLPRPQDCVADQQAGVARWGVADASHQSPAECHTLGGAERNPEEDAQLSQRCTYWNRLHSV